MKIFRLVKTSLLIPLAIFPVAILLTVIGNFLKQPALIGTDFFVQQVPWLANLLVNSGNAIIANIGLFFAIAIAIGLSKRSVAAISAVMGYLMLSAITPTLAPLIGGDAYNILTQQIPMTLVPFDLFAGAALGFISALIANNVENKQNVNNATLFGTEGKILIYSLFIDIVIAVILSIIWPFAFVAISKFLQLLPTLVGQLVTYFFYGFARIILEPLGLSTTLTSLMEYTQIGGVWNSPTGQQVAGDLQIWMAQLATGMPFTAGTISTGSYVLAIFAIPGMALALVRTSMIEHRKTVAAIVLSFSLISIVTGFTLPLEIIILFTSPILYVLHALLSGVLYVILQMSNIFIGATYGGGIIEFIMYGIIPGAGKTGAWLLIIIGFIYFGVYYFSFTALINVFKLKSFGREKEELILLSENNAVHQHSMASQEERIDVIIRALGGYENIKKVAASVYRLHVDVHNIDLVDQQLIKKQGAAGVFEVQGQIQIIFGALTREYLQRFEAKLAEYQQY